MQLKEPHIEFVSIELDNVITSSLTSNFETCNGDNAYSNACSANGIKWADNVGTVTCNKIDYDADASCIS